MDEKDENVINLTVMPAQDSEEEDEVDPLPKKNPFIRGSDPRVATCRGRLQTKRCQLNQDINKELRLRAGAENLFKATTNRKMKETVALELSFVNSNLQLLKEQLAELNSSVELYQNDTKDSVMPMIPLGLKETKEIDFKEAFRDFILEHYSEDASTYEDPLNDFMDMRQAMRTPSRSSDGVALLFKYYNQLYFIERRFFPPDRSLGIYFEWFDSLTGVPSCQRTVAFEKACVLFNMAGIYTQIGAKQDRLSASGLDGAVDALLRAAGTLRYIHENFTNAPSVDLSADTLQILVALMMSQARECLFEKLQLQAREECLRRDLELCDDLDLCIDLCQESAHLSVSYQQLYDDMQSESVLRYMPYSWVSLVHVKTEFYKGLAHHYLATGILNSSVKSSNDRLNTVIADWLEWSDRCKEAIGINAVLKEETLTSLSTVERNTLGKASLQEAVTIYEEACRLQRMCRELRAKEALTRVLRERQEKAHKELAMFESEPDYTDLLDAPQIIASTKFQLSLTPPDFAQHRVEDLFKKLGPIAVFSARRHWTAPRLVQLQKNGRKNRKQDIERNRIDKRDKSEDNSSYYILKNDFERELSKKVSRCSVTKPNGLYVNPYSKNVMESFVKTSTENGIMKLENRGMDRNPLHRKESLHQRESLRRVSSEYNVNGKTDLEDGFGFSVRGDSPVIINSVEPNSLADIGGVRAGDIIVGVGERDVKWRAHGDVVRLIRDCGETVTMRLVTPVAQQTQHSISPVVSKQSSRGGSLSSSSSSGGNSSGRASGNSSGKRSGNSNGVKNGLPTRVPSWNPFKRIERKSTSRNSNVIYR